MSTVDHQTFSQILRDRLRDLLRRTGKPLLLLEAQMGYGNGWLSRKLRGSRPLKLADVDEVLEHLGEPPGALLGVDNDNTNTNEDDHGPGPEEPTAA